MFPKPENIFHTYKPLKISGGGVSGVGVGKIVKRVVTKKITKKYKKKNNKKASKKKGGRVNKKKLRGEAKKRTRRKLRKTPKNSETFLCDTREKTYHLTP